MARSVRQVRTHIDTGDLTTGIFQFNFTPGDLPTGTTLTRLIGAFYFFSRPDADDSAERILYRLGLGVTDTPATVDPSLPNDHPDIWMWWDGTVITMQEQWIDATTSRQVPTSLPISFDVRGQRAIDPVAGRNLYLWARTVGTVGGGLHAIRCNLIAFYLLPFGQ